MPSAIVRLLCDARSQSRTIRDAATGERPFYWRGSSVRFQLALVDNGQFLTASAIGEIVLEVKALTARSTDDSFMRKTFVAADCDNTFTASDWEGGGKQLLEASFTVGEAAILPGSYRVIVRHIDGTGEENTFLSTELQVLEPQSGSEGIDPPPVAWSYLDAVPVVRTDKGPFGSLVEAWEAEINEGEWYPGKDGILKQAKLLIRRVALIGDSLFVGGGTLAGQGFFGFMPALLQHSNYALEVEYPDGSRDASYHAEGGYMSERGPVEAHEILANCWPRPDAALIHYGPNDIGNGLNVETYILNQSHTRNLLKSAGIFPIFLTIAPGGSQLVGGVPYSTRIELFNQALIAAFGNRRDCMVIDSRTVLEQSPGLAKPFYSMDGIHLGPNPVRLWVKDILAKLGSAISPPQSVFRDVLPVNKNPYMKRDGNGTRPLPGGSNTLDAYGLRDDGKQAIGEKWVTILTDQGNPTIGTPGSNAVIYTKKVGVTEAYVNQFADFNANATLSVEMRSANTLRVNLRRSAGSPPGNILSTPAEIAAAVNAFSASPYTASADGTGAATWGSGTAGEFWSAIEAGDEPLHQSDQVRCVFQIAKVPGQPFKIRDAGCYLFTAQGAVTPAPSIINHHSEYYMPLDDGEVLTIISPWATVKTVDATTHQATTPAVIVSWRGYGRFRLARLQVQKRAAPYYGVS